MRRREGGESDRARWEALGRPTPCSAAHDACTRPNPLQAEDRPHTREELLQATGKEPVKVQDTLRSKRKLLQGEKGSGVEVGEVLEASRGGGRTSAPRDPTPGGRAGARVRAGGPVTVPDLPVRDFHAPPSSRGWARGPPPTRRNG
jgi:hypothetical protein